MPHFYLPSILVRSRPLFFMGWEIANSSIPIPAMTKYRSWSNFPHIFIDYSSNMKDSNPILGTNLIMKTFLLPRDFDPCPLHMVLPYQYVDFLVVGLSDGHHSSKKLWKTRENVGFTTISPLTPLSWVEGSILWTLYFCLSYACLAWSVSNHLEVTQ